MDLDWEFLWAPYDTATYQLALGWIEPEDEVLEIGAGDLRLARQIARQARRVWAIERLDEALERGLAQGPLPENLAVLRGDARRLPFPPNLTAGVLLMRHCTHFRLYVEKLLAAGCQRLITNARWRCGVERIDLAASRLEYKAAPTGWFACLCGAVGFKPGPVEEITPEVAETVYEVTACPQCRSHYG
jgi:hypothetical protein